MPDANNTTPSTDALHAQFLRLFLASQREVLRYITALVPDLSEAQEILQETAVALWARFDQYNPSLPFTPWACRFALNTVKQWAGSRQKWRTLLENGLAETIAARRESLLPEMNQRMEQLHHCLEKLPPPQHQVVQQYYFQRQNIETIARQSGRSVEAIYKSLQRIRALLRRCIEGPPMTGETES